jgi:hypothetical protein
VPGLGEFEPRRAGKCGLTGRAQEDYGWRKIKNRAGILPALLFFARFERSGR